MKEWYEIAFDRLYPVLYGHRDQEEARRAVAAFAPRVVHEGRRGPVLDLACGSGRHMSAFAAHGLEMFGLDLSQFLLERAAAVDGLAGRLVRGDMRALPFRGGAFGGVINMFTSFGYFESDDDHRRVLAEVARVLGPGGRFLLDFINAPVVRAALEDDAHGRTTRPGSGGYTIYEDRRVEAGRFLVKRVRVTHAHEEPLEYDERVRLFVPDELERMLAESGLRVVERFGSYDADPFDPDRSDRLILLCDRATDNHGDL